MAEIFNFGIGISIEETGEHARRYLQGMFVDVQNIETAIDSLSGAMLGNPFGADQIAEAAKAAGEYAGAISGGLADVLKEAIEGADIGVAFNAGDLTAIKDGVEEISQAIRSGPKFELVDDDAADEFVLLAGEVNESFETIGDSAEEASKATGKGMNAASESAEELAKKTKEAGDAVEEAESSATSFAGAIKESFTGLEDIVGDVLDSITSVAFEITNLALHPANELERSAVRLSTRLGESSDFTREFTHSVEDLTAKTGFAEAETLLLANTLGAAGHTLAELEKHGTASGEMLVNLHSNLGMGADQVHEFVAASKLMGASVDELATAASDFEEDFKIPGLIEQMPGITQQAIKVQSAFGKSVVKDSKKASVAVTKMAAVYAKALGKTAAEAAEDAMETFSHFAGETRAFQDVFLGLSDDFSPMQNAFLETGMSLERMGGLMQRAQTDQAGFVDEVKRIQSTLDPQMGERFFQQILRNSPPALQAMLTQTEAQKAAAAAEAEAAESAKAKAAERAQQTDRLMKRFDSMRENVLDTFAKYANSIDGLVNRVVRLFGPGITAGFESLLGYVDKGITYFEQFKHKLEETEGASGGLTQIIGKITEGSVGLSAVLGGAAAAFGFVIKFAKPLWTIGKNLWGMFKKVKTSMGAAGVRGSANALGKVLGKLALPIGVLIAGFEHFKKAGLEIFDTLTDESMDAETKFKNVMASIGKALWGTFDDFFLGLPQKFVDGFTGTGKDVENKGAKELGRSVGRMLGKVLAKISDFAREVWPKFKLWISDVASKMETEGGGSILVGLHRSIMNGLESMGTAIGDFFGEVFVGIAEQFGYPAEVVQEKVEVVKAVFGAAWTFMRTEAEGQFDILVTGVKLGFKLIVGALTYMVEEFQLKSALIKDVWNGNFRGIGIFFLDVIRDMGKILTTFVDGALGYAQQLVNAFASIPVFGEKFKGMGEGIGKLRKSVTGFGDDLDKLVAGESALAAEKDSAYAKEQLRIQTAREERARALKEDIDGFKKRKAEREKARAASIGKVVDAVDRVGTHEAEQVENARLGAIKAARNARELRQVRQVRQAREAAASEVMQAATLAELSSSQVAERAAGYNQSELNTLVSTLTALMQQQASGAPGSAGVGAAADQIKIQLAASSEGRDLLERALTQFQIQQVNGRMK